MEFQKGQVITYQRTFTKKEVQEYMVIGDFVGKHHEIPNEEGQYLLQGLLTAGLTNKIGGDYNIIVYRMEFDFLNKAYTDREMTCVNHIDDVMEKHGKKHLIISSTVTDDRGIVVLKGRLKGIQLEFEK